MTGSKLFWLEQERERERERKRERSKEKRNKPPQLNNFRT